MMFIQRGGLRTSEKLGLNFKNIYIYISNELKRLSLILNLVF